MLRVSRLVKRFSGEKAADVRAVNDVSFEVPIGRFFTLLGPSGCGKTTTLRCIAGLERPDDGVITIDEHAVSSPRDRIHVPPYRREIGMVFQSYAIWPHMTVFENVAFPLRVGRERFSRAQVRDKVDKALATVQLSGLEDRPAPKLSGGQQQRLALARALVREPKLLLLDEPLSNLDAKLREQMRIELRELQRRLRITTVYVTHDQGEALAMSNLIAVMQAGEIVQVGAPREIYRQPNGKFVADFIGSANFVGGRVQCVGPHGQPSEVATRQGTLRCLLLDGARVGDDVLVSVRPEEVRVYRTPPPDPVNVFPAKVAVAVFLGEHLDCQIDWGGELLLAHVHPSTDVRRGDEVFIQLPCERCTIVPT